MNTQIQDNHTNSSSIYFVDHCQFNFESLLNPRSFFNLVYY